MLAVLRSFIPQLVPVLLTNMAYELDDEEVVEWGSTSTSTRTSTRTSRRTSTPRTTYRFQYIFNQKTHLKN